MNMGSGIASLASGDDHSAIGHDSIKQPDEQIVCEELSEHIREQGNAVSEQESKGHIDHITPKVLDFTPLFYIFPAFYTPKYPQNAKKK